MNERHHHRRFAVAPSPFFALVALLTLGTGLARAQDVIYYTEKGKTGEQTFKGAIEDESPAGVKVKINKKDTILPPDSISSIVYKCEIDAATYRRPFNAEEKARKEANPKKRDALLLDAASGYADLEKQIRTRSQARRYLQYKKAEVAVLQAQADNTKVPEAIKLLNEFKRGNTSSWQIVPALKALARLQEDSGQIEDAGKTYEELADLPEAPAELKQESGLLVGRLLVRGGKFAEAKKRLEKMASGLSPGNPQAPFIRGYLIESRIGLGELTTAVKDATEVIRSSNDGRVRGLAHNLLGDYYQKSGQPAEALWQYLRVDSLYNDDLEEHAKALYHLGTLFDKVRSDPLRGKDCFSRLMDKRFAATAFHKLAIKEGKAKPAMAEEK